MKKMENSRDLFLPACGAGEPEKISEEKAEGKLNEGKIRNPNIEIRNKFELPKWKMTETRRLHVSIISLFDHSVLV